MLIETTGPTALSDFWRRIQNKELTLPAHQRADVWPKEKIEGWFKSIREASEDNGLLSGMITTYRIKSASKSRNRYINDGAQRIVFNLPKFQDRCSSQKEFDDILSKVKITEQSVVYDNEEEAINNFIDLNKGTICTPFELTRSIFVAHLSSNTMFETVWDPIFNQLNTVVSDSLVRIGCKNDVIRTPQNSREMIHKKMRDNLLLFYIFLTEDASRIRYKPASSSIKDWESQTKVETELASLFKRKGAPWVTKRLESFRLFLERATSFYHQIWIETISETEAPTPVHIRWWFQVYLALNHSKMKVANIRKFTKALIAQTKGKTTLYYGGEDRKHSSIGLGDLSKITAVFNILGLSELNSDVPIKCKKSKSLRVGYVNSHINAYSAHGDGETVPENAVENAARSARDMTPDEKSKLKKLKAPKQTNHN